MARRIKSRKIDNSASGESLHAIQNKAKAVNTRQQKKKIWFHMTTITTKKKKKKISAMKHSRGATTPSRQWRPANAGTDASSESTSVRSGSRAARAASADSGIQPRLRIHESNSNSNGNGIYTPKPLVVAVLVRQAAVVVAVTARTPPLLLSSAASARTGCRRATTARSRAATWCHRSASRQLASWHAGGSTCPRT